MNTLADCSAWQDDGYAHTRDKHTRSNRHNVGGDRKGSNLSPQPKWRNEPAVCQRGVVKKRERERRIPFIRIIPVFVWNLVIFVLVERNAILIMDWWNMGDDLWSKTLHVVSHVVRSYTVSHVGSALCFLYGWNGHLPPWNTYHNIKQLAYFLISYPCPHTLALPSATVTAPTRK